MEIMSILELIYWEFIEAQCGNNLQINQNLPYNLGVADHTNMVSQDRVFGETQ